MEPISSFFKSTIPHYFEGLPIPDTFGGWFRLGFKDWLSLVPLGAVLGGMGYMSYQVVHGKKEKSPMINPDIHKENGKHVDVRDIESLGDKTAFCRCWRSRTFPYCDGSHNAHNQRTGDNVGPLVIQRKK